VTSQVRVSGGMILKLKDVRNNVNRTNWGGYQALAPSDASWNHMIDFLTNTQALNVTSSILGN